MSPVLRNHARFWGDGIAVYGDYRPWGVHKAAGGDKSNYPEHSGRILDLKDGKAVGVAYFKDRIAPGLCDGVAVVTVPSHDPAKPGLGLRALAAELATGTRVDASSCLVRTEKIAKLAGGGDRSEEVHLKSVAVANSALIKGRDVLLLDDVAKTGNSLTACRKLLLESGARSVQCAAIGKT